MASIARQSSWQCLVLFVSGLVSSRPVAAESNKPADIEFDVDAAISTIPESEIQMEESSEVFSLSLDDLADSDRGVAVEMEIDEITITPADSNHELLSQLSIPVCVLK